MVAVDAAISRGVGDGPPVASRPFVDGFIKVKGENDECNDWEVRSDQIRRVRTDMKPSDQQRSDQKRPDSKRPDWRDQSRRDQM